MGRGGGHVIVKIVHYLLIYIFSILIVHYFYKKRSVRVSDSTVNIGFYK